MKWATSTLTRAGVLQILKTVEAGSRAASKRAELREDEPHPVGFLAASSKFGEHIIDDAGLGGKKAGKVGLGRHDEWNNKKFTEGSLSTSDRSSGEGSDAFFTFLISSH